MSTGARDGRLPPHRRAAHRVRGREVEVGRRHRLRRRRGLPLHLRPQEGHDHLGRRQHLPGRDRGGAPRVHPQVLDVAVFGIPDDEWGESVYCIVQAKPGQTIDLDELRAFAGSQHGEVQACRAATRSATSCPAPTPASCSSASSATSSGPTAPSELGGAHAPDVRRARSGCAPRNRRDGASTTRWSVTVFPLVDRGSNRPNGMNGRCSPVRAVRHLADPFARPTDTAAITRRNRARSPECFRDSMLTAE